MTDPRQGVRHPSGIMKIGLVACGAIVRELIAVANRQAWEFELTAVPAQLHNRPERIPAAVRARLDAWAGRFDVILVGYGDCGTGGALDATLADYPHVARIDGPHCYDFYGGEAFTTHNDAFPGTFYVTDFLARHFDGLVWKGLGLDRYPELLPTYFGNYTHLMYLQQLPEQDESLRAQSGAERIGVDYLYVDTGLDEFERRVVAAVRQAQAAGAPSSAEPNGRATTDPATGDDPCGG